MRYISMNAKDAKRRTGTSIDICMCTRNMHENVCNSHHHSRMMIRKNEEQKHEWSKERERKRNRLQENIYIYMYVRRAERTWRMRFFLLGSYKFCGLFEKKKKNERKNK